MSMSVNRKVWLAIIGVLLVVMIGCSNQDPVGDESVPAQSSRTAEGGNEPAEENKKAEPSSEPVTLAMYNHFNNISEEKYERYIIEPLAEHLPHITLKLISHGQGSTIDDLVAANQFPDFYYGSNVGFPSYLNLGLERDMKDLLVKHQFDWARFEQYAVNGVEHFGENGEIYGVPFSNNIGVLVYNKDIFDRFGVDYPEDGMTWDAVIDLSTGLTRYDNDVQYVGFDPGKPAQMGSGLALAFVDESEGKALIDIPGWRQVLGVFQKVYAQPGYVSEDGKHYFGSTGFYADQTTAMMPIWALQLTNQKERLQEMEWDIVSYPNFEGHVGKGREVDFHMIALSKTSEHPDAAIEVLKVITADDVQLRMAREGTPSVLKNEDTKTAFGSEEPLFDGKNVDALFKTTPQDVHDITQYDGLIRSLIEGATAKIAEGVDLNTLMRELQEEGDQLLKEALK